MMMQSISVLFLDFLVLRGAIPILIHFEKCFTPGTNTSECNVSSAMNH